MHFSHPLFLWLIPPVLLLLHLAFVVSRRHQSALATRYTGAGLRAWARPGFVPWRQRLDLLLALGATGCLLVALARPRIYRSPSDDELHGVPFLVAIDASRSMLATDIRPNRWTVATNQLDQFLAASRADRVGLISFSGVAYLNAPLSFDMAAVRTTLRYLSPQLMTDPGSSLASAIDRAGRYFASNQIQPRILVLLTDGEDLDGNPALVARQWAREGLRVATIGVGTTTGAPVPASAAAGIAGPARNTFGQEVVSRLNEGNLQRIAAATSGPYYRLGDRGEGLQRLRTEFLNPQAESAARADLQNYQEWYYLPTALAFLCLVGRLATGRNRFQTPRTPSAIHPQVTRP